MSWWPLPWSSSSRRSPEPMHRLQPTLLLSTPVRRRRSSCSSLECSTTRVRMPWSYASLSTVSSMNGPLNKCTPTTQVRVDSVAAISAVVARRRPKLPVVRRQSAAAVVPAACRRLASYARQVRSRPAHRYPWLTLPRLPLLCSARRRCSLDLRSIRTHYCSVPPLAHLASERRARRRRRLRAPPPPSQSPMCSCRG